MINEFNKYLLGEFVGPNKELYALVEEYYQLCDEFDALVCPYSKEHKTHMPINVEQYIIINKHAVEVWKETLQRAKDMGFTEQVFKEYASQYGCTMRGEAITWA